MTVSSQPLPTTQVWFCLAVDENSEISSEAKRAAKVLTIPNVARSSLCIEISIKTLDGDSMVMETWVLSWARDSPSDNPQARPDRWDENKSPKVRTTTSLTLIQVYITFAYCSPFSP